MSESRVVRKVPALMLGFLLCLGALLIGGLLFTRASESIPMADKISNSKDSDKTVTLTYKISDPEGGTLSVTEEKVAPNAQKISGTRVMLTDLWDITGWWVDGVRLGPEIGPTLTQKIIDSFAKRNGVYKDTTFVAIVRNNQHAGSFKKGIGIIPLPNDIPRGKKLKGIEVLYDGVSDGILRQVGDEFPDGVGKVRLHRVYEDNDKTIKLTYKLSDPEGGTLSSAEEMIPPNAETVAGTTLTLKREYQLTGWEVEGTGVVFGNNGTLVLSKEMIDLVALEKGIYHETTFIARVEKIPVTITIKEPGQSDRKEVVPTGDEFTLPPPRKIPPGKTLEGIKIDGKDDGIKQPGDKVSATKDTTLEYKFKDSEKTVKLTYKLSDPDGGTLSATEEMVAPNAVTVTGATLTLKDGYQLEGWEVEGTEFVWGNKDSLVLTKDVIDRFAKENEIYKNTTFVALVQKKTFVITIKEPGKPDREEKVLQGDEFTLPPPREIPPGKTLEGIKIDGKDDGIKQPGDKVPATKDTTLEYKFKDSEKTVKLSYKLSDPDGGTLSAAEEMVAPNAATATGTTLTLKEGYQLEGWEVEGTEFVWGNKDSLVLTKDVIDRLAKENGVYKNTTFTALVKKEVVPKTPVTITIKEPGKPDREEKVLQGDEFTLPPPREIPPGKTLEGIKIDGKDDGIKQPGDKVPATKDTTLEYKFKDSEKTVKLTYKLSDPNGGTLSAAEEMVAPNAATVTGTTLTLKEGYQLAGWKVEGTDFTWGNKDSLVLAKEVINRIAKENGIYKNTTFIALVKKEAVTITIKMPGQPDRKEEVPTGSEFTLPPPPEIPPGKTLEGIKIGGKDDGIKQPGEKVPATKDTTVEYKFKDSEKTVKLTYKLSDPNGGTLSATEEMVAPNAATVTGATLTLKEGYQLEGWKVEGTDFTWGNKDSLVLTKDVIDRIAKENGIYKNTTFIALVKKAAVTITIKMPGQPDRKEEVPAGSEFTLPPPPEIPPGKTLEGIKIGGKDDGIKQPGEKVPATKDTTVEYKFKDSEKTVKLTYKLSDPNGGTLSAAEEMVAPNAATVTGATLTLKEGYQLEGWKVEGADFTWGNKDSLVLTKDVIDRLAKENGIYKNTTFIALVKKAAVTITIKMPGQPDRKEEVPAGSEFTLPPPPEIPPGKTLEGIKIGGKDDGIKQPGEKVPATKDTTVEYKFKDSEKTVKLTYKLSDPNGGTLSAAEEMVAPNAATVTGATLTLKEGYQLEGWKVEGADFTWGNKDSLVLTKDVIDRLAKENGIYKNTTFIALVKKAAVTITIKMPGQPDRKEEVPAGSEFTLPPPPEIPPGKTLEGIKIGGKDDGIKQPGEKVPATKDTTVEYKFKDSEKTVKLTYKLSDPNGGTLSAAEEMVAPNAATVTGATLSLKEGYQLEGWKVEGADFTWGNKDSLVLTKDVIDRLAKENGIYKNTTFIALVKKAAVTITIKMPGQPDRKEEVPKGSEFTLPPPPEIPPGKTLEGIKIGGKDDGIKQPGEKVPATKDTTVEYKFKDSEKTVKLTYKLSDPNGGTLSAAEEMVAPNAATVTGATLTLKEGYQLEGWKVEGADFTWGNKDSLVLTKDVIDRLAKENGIYKNTTFIALVKKAAVTITIKMPGQPDRKEEVPAGSEFTLPPPPEIPPGKTLEGIKIGGKDDGIKQPGEKVPATKDTTVEYKFKDSEKTVKLTYKLSDPNGGTLSATEEMVAPNAATVTGATLTLKDGYQLEGWKVEGTDFTWGNKDSLVLTKDVIDRLAKENGIYKNTTFIALVKKEAAPKTPVTITIKIPGQPDRKEEVPEGSEFILPPPPEIPPGKTLEGIKIGGKDDGIKQPGDKVPATKDTTLEYKFKDNEKTVKLTYKLSDPDGGTLSAAEEMVAPNAATVTGATLTLKDGYQLEGWKVEGTDFTWGNKDSLVLTKDVIDRLAKENGIYKNTTFIAVVKKEAAPKTPVTITIKIPGQPDRKEEVPEGSEFILPPPPEIPPGKTLEGIKIGGKDDGIKQPGDKVPATKDTTLEYKFKDNEKTVKLTYKLSDPDGGTLSAAEEMVAPNAATVTGATLTLKDGYQLEGWKVEGTDFTWGNKDSLVLTKDVIDRLAKENGIYKNTTFIAVVKKEAAPKTPVTITIKIPGQPDRKEEVPEGSEFILPPPPEIPPGKTLEGIKIGGKDDGIKQPGDKVPATKDTTLEYKFKDSEKTVKLTYKLSDPNGGTLSAAEEMVAPNAATVTGATLTLKDGYQLEGWKVEGTDFTWGNKDSLVLTKDVIDRLAKENGIYKNTTFIAVVKKEAAPKTPVTITIKMPGQPDRKEEVPAGSEFTLPPPPEIPPGKTLEGIKIGGKDDGIKQPGDKVPATKDTTLEYKFKDNEKTVKLTYKLSDPNGGTLSATEEMVAPNAATVTGATLTLKDGYQLEGWKVEGTDFTWGNKDSLVLTKDVIDRLAKENGIYKNTTFIAVVKKEAAPKTPVTITIKIPGQPDRKEEVPEGSEFILPPPPEIPPGKTLEGIKIGGKDDGIKQPGDKVPATKDTTLEYKFKDSEKTVKLTYKLSDPDGGTLSAAEEMVAPNAATVTGATLTLKDGYQLEGWKVEGTDFTWGNKDSLVLTKDVIDRLAKENGIYKNTTFIALVKKEAVTETPTPEVPMSETTITITIKIPGQPDRKEEVPEGSEFILPPPPEIPPGKTLEGIKIDGQDDGIKQPGDKVPATKDTTLEYKFKDSEKTVKLTYKLSDPDGGTLSAAEEMVAPNAATVTGATLTLKDGYQLAGWKVEGTDFVWGNKDSLVLTKDVIDRLAKENGIYKNTTFIALVKKAAVTETPTPETPTPETPITITIKIPGQPDRKEEVPAGSEFILPPPPDIPPGKTFEGIKIDGQDDGIKQPGDKVPATKDTTLEYKFKDKDSGRDDTDGSGEGSGTSRDDGTSGTSRGDGIGRGDGWQRQGGKVFYYRGGKKLVGWHELSGTIQDPASSKKNWFYFGNDGVMFTGRHKLVGGFPNSQGIQEQHWFALDEVTGAQIRYWHKVGTGSGEKWYYYRPEDGTGLVGRHHIIGGFANAQGVHELNWFFFDLDTGAEIRGWHRIVENGVENWYYYRDGDGIMLKGQHELVGGFDQRMNWFYFDDVTGIEVRGWKYIDYQNKWCYYRDGDGIMLKGQHRLVGGFDQCENWFYFDEVTGGEIRGWKYIDYQDKWCYYRDGDGIMLKGQHKLQGGDDDDMNWFYFDEETGAELRNTWKYIDYQDKTCYYGTDGAMHKGWSWIDGRSYYFNRATGALS